MSWTSTTRRGLFAGAAAQLAQPSRWPDPAAMAEEVSRGRWIRAPHLTLLAEAFAGAVRTPGSRLFITLPPRHGKTEGLTRWGTGWALEDDPARRVLIASYGSAYATRHGRWVRNLVRDHPADLRVRLAEDSTRQDEWETTAGGGVVSAGVGEGITGRGFDLVLIDDPVKGRADVESPTYRQKQWDWYTDDLSTRLEPGASIAVIQTRWHRDDLAGRLLAEAKAGGEVWQVVHLPAIAEAPRDGEPPDALGREPGEALWPDRYPLPVLEDIRRRLGTYGWASLYQGRPRPRGGGAYWTDEDFRLARERAPRTAAGELAAELARVVVAVDPAGSADAGSDETGIVVAGKERRLDRAGVLADLSGIHSTDEWGRRAVQAYLDHQADVILYESNYGGNAMASVIRNAAKAMGVRTPPIRAVVAKRGKALRAEPVHQLYREGLIWHASLWPDLEEQGTTWTPESKDSPDRLDALVYALTELMGGRGRGLVVT